MKLLWQTEIIIGTMDPIFNLAREDARIIISTPFGVFRCDNCGEKNVRHGHVIIGVKQTGMMCNRKEIAFICDSCFYDKHIDMSKIYSIIANFMEPGLERFREAVEKRF